MSAPAQPKPRIFVSYSHKDDAFTRRLVDRLHAAGAEVWVDSAGINHGNFMQRIDEALARCEWMVLVLTPDAIASEYVRDEVFTALHRVKQGFIRDVIPVLATACDPRTIPPTWDVLQRYDATRDEAEALADVLRALGLTPAAIDTSQAKQETGDQLAVRLGRGVAGAWQPPQIPPEHFPARLAELGFTARKIGGVEVIVPPLCLVPTGEFLMGSDPKRDSQTRDDEKPQHRVMLEAFQIGRFPVTVAEFNCYLRANGQTASAGILDHPVVRVSWDDATAYAVWLAQRTGQMWHLPTEAEWEKAARWDPVQQVAHLYPWGDSFEQSRANTSGSDKRFTTPVGIYPTGASPCGAQDMAGNIWEWTSSAYRPYPYNAADGRETADRFEEGVQRGGSWFTGPAAARAACRDHMWRSFHLDFQGFRLACVPVQ